MIEPSEYSAIEITLDRVSRQLGPLLNKSTKKELADASYILSVVRKYSHYLATCSEADRPQALQDLHDDLYR